MARERTLGFFPLEPMRTPVPLYAAVLVFRVSGEVVFVNPGARELLGVGEGEIWNREQILACFFAEEELRVQAEGILDRAFRAADRRGSLSLEARLPGKGGRTGSWSLQVCSIPDFLGPAVLVSFQPRAEGDRSAEDPAAPLFAAAREACRLLDRALEATGSWSGDPRLGRAGTALRRAHAWLATLGAGSHGEAGMAAGRNRAQGRIG